MPPIIGITAGHAKNAHQQTTVNLTRAYVEAVVQAGGVPVLVPPSDDADGWRSLFARLDGILFSGGGDISLQNFAGEPHACIDDVDQARDAVELSFLREAVSIGKPFLGICRGCQLVNVGLGGTLYTHLPDQLKGALHHNNPGNMRHVLEHEVKLEESTRLGEVMGNPLLHVNSHHHQGLKDISPALRIAGRSADGLVEAVELPDHPFGMAVQWHPEWLTDQEPTQRLFKRFVDAATRA